MEDTPKSTVQMHALLLCTDVPFLGITRNVLSQLHVTPKLVNTSAAALAMIQTHEFDVIIVDWREIDNLAEFLTRVGDSRYLWSSVSLHSGVPEGCAAAMAH